MMASSAAVGRRPPAAAPAASAAAAATAAAEGAATLACRRDGSRVRQGRWTGMRGAVCALAPRQPSVRRPQFVRRHRRQRRAQRHPQAAHPQPAALLACSRRSRPRPRRNRLGAGARSLQFSRCTSYRHRGRKPRRHTPRTAKTPRRQVSRTIGRRLKEAHVEVPVRVMLAPIGKKTTGLVLLHSSSARSNVRSGNSPREA